MQTMTSSGLPSDDQSQPSFAEPGDGNSPPACDDDLMEQVLAETLAAASGGSPLDPREVEVLKNVARRYPGRAVECDPMVIELVQALLAFRLPRLADGSPRWQQMTGQIAETLWDDPVGRQRLESLWRQLRQGEAVR